MTFKVIAPFVSCVVNEMFDTPKDTLSEFDEAVNAGYPNIYMLTSNGIIHHRSFRPGKEGKPRFIRIPVKEIPGLKLKNVAAKVSFLPEGKIPVRLLTEIKAFFKKVIEKRGTAVEAMIWILWDESKGYHLFVPNQIVSHASARYDWSTVPLGSSIIVDIHSHADFSAFFSGTDNADDKGSVRYSGVIGHNNTDNQDMVWRFNHPGGTIEAKLEDLFETPVAQQPEVPDSWLDRVQAPPPQVAGAGVGAGKGSHYARYMKGRYVDPDEGSSQGAPGYQSEFFNKPKGGGNEKGLHSPFSDDSVERGQFGKIDRGPWSKTSSHKGMNYNPRTPSPADRGLGIVVFGDDGLPDSENDAFEQEGALKKKARRGRKTLVAGRTNG